MLPDEFSFKDLEQIMLSLNLNLVIVVGALQSHNFKRLKNILIIAV